MLNFYIEEFEQKKRGFFSFINPNGEIKRKLNIKIKI